MKVYHIVYNVEMSCCCLIYKTKIPCPRQGTLGTRVTDGGSFGLQVAALAGLPRTVITQARRTLAELEAKSIHTDQLSPAALDQPQQMGLFTTASPLAEALAQIEPDELTPKQALEALYRLKQMG